MSEVTQIQKYLQGGALIRNHSPHLPVFAAWNLLTAGCVTFLKNYSSMVL